MNEEDYKEIITVYQQRAFELFNKNIVLEAQVNKLNVTISSLLEELESLKRPTRKTVKTSDEF